MIEVGRPHTQNITNIHHISSSCGKAERLRRDKTPSWHTTFASITPLIHTLLIFILRMSCGTLHVFRVLLVSTLNVCVIKSIRRIGKSTENFRKCARYIYFHEYDTVCAIDIRMNSKTTQTK